MMKRVLISLCLSACTLAIASPALAGQGDPSSTGTGPPSQSCQAQPSSPGHASSSPGSPFNEPSSTSNGGTGGQNYSPNSQYDVACYHASHHP